MKRSIPRLRRAAFNSLLRLQRARNSVVGLFDKRLPLYGEFLVDRRIRRTFFPDYETVSCMVEVGCASPDLLSMSKHFRDSGWRCINIEPHPKFAAMQRAAGSEIYEYTAADFNSDEQRAPSVPTSGPISR